jgi:hypothetical protein
MSKYKFNVVYKITNLINDKVYIGAHQTNNLDDGYMGSGNLIRNAIKKYGLENFQKDVLCNFDSVEEMFYKELELVNLAFVKRNDTYNLTVGGPNPKTYEKVLVKDTNGKTFLIDVTDSRYLSGELVYFLKTLLKNRIKVADKNGKRFFVNKDDSRYLNGELKFKWKKGPLTKEHREKISKANSISQKGERNSQFGTTWVYNETETKKIKKKDLQSYLDQGWIYGRRKKK